MDIDTRIPPSPLVLEKCVPLEGAAELSEGRPLSCAILWTNRTKSKCMFVYRHGYGIKNVDVQAYVAEADTQVDIRTYLHTHICPYTHTRIYVHLCVPREDDIEEVRTGEPHQTHKEAA